MKGPRLERTASLITVPPASGKYENLGAGSALENPLLPLNPYGSALRALFLLVRATTMSSDPLNLPCNGLCSWKIKHTLRLEQCFFFFFFSLNEGFFPEGKWAALGGSAIPRQPVAGDEASPLFHSPVPKISLIYELLNEQRIRY